MSEEPRYTAPFNGPIEMGLRALALLSEAYPREFSLQRLVILDYLIVHSDDIPEGPPGIHPKTPRRGGDLQVRRKAVEHGLLLYQSRGLVELYYRDGGLYYLASERAGAYLDALSQAYTKKLRDRAEWLAQRFEHASDDDLTRLISENVQKWGAEFANEATLWLEEPT